MNKFIALITLLISTLQAAAQQKNGYDIKVKFKQPVSDKYIFLANYYAKAMPTVYKKDSAAVSNNGTVAHFKSNQALTGGVFILFFNERNQYIEVLIDNGDQFEILIDTLALPLGSTYKNSISNVDYLKMNKNFEQLRTLMNSEKQKLEQGTISLVQYQEAVKKESKLTHEKNLEIANQHPKKSLIHSLIYAVTPADVNHPIELTNDADSAYIFYLQKENYWANYDFKDERLMYSPLYENKLNYYIDKLVYNYIPDSLIYEAERLLYYTKNSKEHFRYTLNWLTQYVYKSKVMGLDEVFVHLVEQYYMTGKADWLDEKALDTYVKRAQALAPNVLGKKGADISLHDLNSLNPYNLYDFDAAYTLLVIWSIDCHVCKEEVPLLKTLYDKSLKAKGVKIFSIPTGKAQEEIQAAVAKYGIEEWKHVIDISGKSDYVANYDAYTKPKIYLLDKNKIIKGKLLNHTNIEQLLDFLIKSTDK